MYAAGRRCSLVVETPGRPRREHSSDDQIAVRPSTFAGVIEIDGAPISVAAGREPMLQAVLGAIAVTKGPVEVAEAATELTAEAARDFLSWLAEQ
jgi:hypothetical protein